MTKDEFLQLSQPDQDSFINSGGVIQDSVPTIQEPVEEQVGTSEGLIQPSLSDSGGEPVESSQPAPPLASEPITGELSVYSEGFAIESPVELLYLLDDDLRSGKISLHDWQVQFLMDFSDERHVDTHPFQAVMPACNGSGKDKYIIASCSIWLNMRYKLSRGVITSSSGTQLDNQTCAYIDELAGEANRKFGTVWKLNYRYYECLATRSPIACYATDEPGKAEGYHPLAFGRKMGIYLSEDKSIPDSINTAVNKCTGYTHRCHVSTPGNSYGHFHDLCSGALPRDLLNDVKSLKAEDYIKYHVPAYNKKYGSPEKDPNRQCPHLSLAYIRQMARDLPGGINGGAFKSQVLAEFCATDEQVVLTFPDVYKAKRKPLEDWKMEQFNKGGLDLSLGGAETVLITRNGNRILHVDPFKFDDSEDTVSFLDDLFRRRDLDHPESLIFGDCVGAGYPILCRLRRMGWNNIRFVDSRHKARRATVYRNYITELWFNFAQWCKNDEIILVDDDTLCKQLATRYYKLQDGKIHQLLSKPEQLNKGYPSPDRADACVMAFTDYESQFTEPDEVKAPYHEEKKKEEITGAFTLKAMARGDFRTYKTSSYVVNGGQKNFDDLQEQVADYNRKQLT